jgi:hypothetical protein
VSSLWRSHLPTALSAAVALAVQLHGSTSSAHIELQLPMNRYSDIKAGDNKSCPCGSGSSNRRCSVPSEFSDPDRSTDRITTFAPGDTITVRFDEYVGHAGRFRVAFDPDGADLGDFNETVLLDEVDPAGRAGNMGSGSMWEFEVTLPNMTCDNCTLQLVQVMDGITDEQVGDRVNSASTYFQCADIRLVDGTPAGGIEPSAPTDHPGVRGRDELADAQAAAAAANAAMDELPGAMDPGSGSMTGTEVSMANPSNETGTSPMMASSPGAESGCSLVGVGSERARRSTAAVLVLGSVLLLGLRQRRR